MNMLMTAPCLLSVEGLVGDELKQMGAQNVCPENARVFFEGDETILARANIWSRFSLSNFPQVLVFMSSSFIDIMCYGIYHTTAFYCGTYPTCCPGIRRCKG